MCEVGYEYRTNTNECEKNGDDWWETSWGLGILIGGNLLFAFIVIAVALYLAGKLWFKHADDEAREARVRKQEKEESIMLGVSLVYLLNELEDDADAAAKHGIADKKLYKYSSDSDMLDHDQLVGGKLEEAAGDKKKEKEATDLIAKHQQAAEEEFHQKLLIKKLEEAIGDKKKVPDGSLGEGEDGSTSVKSVLSSAGGVLEERIRVAQAAINKHGAAHDDEGEQLRKLELEKMEKVKILIAKHQQAADGVARANANQNKAEQGEAQDKQTCLRQQLRAECKYVGICKETKRLDPNFYHINVT